MSKTKELENENALVVVEETPEAPKGRMKRTRNEMSIRNLEKQRENVRFDLAIQRNNVWKPHQKSLLVHSILDEYPIPQLFVQASDDDQLWMLDGKQRMSTVFEYIDGKFAILKNTPPVMVQTKEGVEFVEVEGKFFDDLSEELKAQFLDYTLTIVEMKNITQFQIEELFQRLNNGSALTKIEMTRAKAGVITNYVNHLSAKPFFKSYAFISDTARNRFVDYELIAQILLLVSGRETGISSKEVEDFVDALKTTGVDAETQNILNGTADYLYDAFTPLVQWKDGKADHKILNKMLKKIHIPMLFLTAIEAAHNEIMPEAFGKWAQDFLIERYTSGSGAYGSRTVAGSAKKENVQGRIKAMKVDFAKHIAKFQAGVEAELAEKQASAGQGDNDQEPKNEDQPPSSEGGEASPEDGENKE